MRKNEGGYGNLPFGLDALKLACESWWYPRGTWPHARQLPPLLQPADAACELGCCNPVNLVAALYLIACIPKIVCLDLWVINSEEQCSLAHWEEWRLLSYFIWNVHEIQYIGFRELWTPLTIPRLSGWISYRSIRIIRSWMSKADFLCDLVDSQIRHLYLGSLSDDPFFSWSESYGIPSLNRAEHFHRLSSLQPIKCKVYFGPRTGCGSLNWYRTDGS